MGIFLIGKSVCNAVYLFSSSASNHFYADLQRIWRSSVFPWGDRRWATGRFEGICRARGNLEEGGAGAVQSRSTPSAVLVSAPLSSLAPELPFPKAQDDLRGCFRRYYGRSGISSFAFQPRDSD